jgi:23S rRNA pseudouridine1911/1915/1917 synthase
MSNCPTDTATGPLLDWLLRQYPDTPRTRAKQWILAGRVSLNGMVIRKPHHIIPDPKDALQLGARLAPLAGGSGWRIHPRVSLLYLDCALAVVNKGPGLISVPASNSGPSALGLLADFLAGRLGTGKQGADQMPLPPAYRRLKPLPVHRLDQYTSGVFCMATNPAARRHLIAQVQARTMKRGYVAFVEGRPPSPKGVWRHWLRLDGDKLRQQVISATEAKAAGPAACQAITHYEVLAEFPRAGGQGVISKLRLRLETGLKHQIRIQAAQAGLPLVGDRAYHPGYRDSARGGASIHFPRQALHAEILELEHPDQPGKRMAWTVDLPEDLLRLEDALRARRL